MLSVKWLKIPVAMQIYDGKKRGRRYSIACQRYDTLSSTSYRFVVGCTPYRWADEGATKKKKYKK